MSDIKEWMLLNKLKLNDSKTEFPKFQPQHQKDLRPTITIGVDVINTSMTAQKGVLLDSYLSFSDHITSIVSLLTSNCISLTALANI